MAEIFKEDKELEFACYCKALSLKSPNEFLIKENIEVEIEECASLEALRHVYSKYPELQKKILPSIMLKKSELESLGKSINNT